jgi:hypothetical protein
MSSRRPVLTVGRAVETSRYTLALRRREQNQWDGSTIPERSDGLAGVGQVRGRRPGRLANDVARRPWRGCNPRGSLEANGSMMSCACEGSGVQSMGDGEGAALVAKGLGTSPGFGGSGGGVIGPWARGAEACASPDFRAHGSDRDERTNRENPMSAAGEDIDPRQAGRGAKRQRRRTSKAQRARDGILARLADRAQLRHRRLDASPS